MKVNYEGRIAVGRGQGTGGRDQGLGVGDQVSGEKLKTKNQKPKTDFKIETGLSGTMSPWACMKFFTLS